MEKVSARKRGVSQDKGFTSDASSSPPTKTVCPDASLVSSHRRCLVVSLPSEHAVNDLKRAVPPWESPRRENGGVGEQRLVAHRGVERLAFRKMKMTLQVISFGQVQLLVLLILSMLWKSKV